MCDFVPASHLQQLPTCAPSPGTSPPVSSLYWSWRGLPTFEYVYLKIYLLIISDVRVCVPECVFVYHMCTGAPEGRRAHRIPWNWSYQPWITTLCGCWEPKLGPPWEQHVIWFIPYLPWSMIACCLLEMARGSDRLQSPSSDPLWPSWGLHLCYPLLLAHCIQLNLTFLSCFYQGIFIAATAK